MCVIWQHPMHESEAHGAHGAPSQLYVWSGCLRKNRRIPFLFLVLNLFSCFKAWGGRPLEGGSSSS